jgi:DNA-binding transcriptional regulator YiaG
MTIKEARIKAGLTQEKLSDLLGIPKRSIENWEGGKRNPPPYVERLIVEKLQTMSEQMLIPRRTIEDWERSLNSPPPYVQRLILNELKTDCKFNDHKENENG